MKSLIFETEATGHRSGYVVHLMRYIVSRPELHGRYTFILNGNMRPFLGASGNSEAFEVNYVDCGRRYANAVARSMHEWKIIAGALREKGPFGEIIFLDIDRFLPLLMFRRFRQPGLSLKGILFQPYLHYKESWAGPWFYWRHTVRSYLFQKLSTLLNPGIHKLFILNDKTCLPAMNREIKPVFYFLPDPVSRETAVADPDIREKTAAKFHMNGKKKNLLVFGSIDARKNLIRIVNSVLLLPDAVKQDVHLVIAGKFGGSPGQRYKDYLNRRAGEVSLVYRDQFVSDAERDVLFRYCDLVLMPYINFFGSSGILGHAIKHGKPVIASRTGITGKTVSGNNLGIVVDPENETEIRDAIVNVLAGTGNFQYDSRTLLEECDPGNFCKTLLSL